MLRATLILAIIGFSLIAYAKMPPHFNKSVPADNGALKGDTVILHGYSLGEHWLKTSVTIVNSKTKAPVGFTVSSKCTAVGKCGPKAPRGACQDKCVARIKLSAVIKGQTYRLKLGRRITTFTAAKTITNAPTSKPTK